MVFRNMAELADIVTQLKTVLAYHRNLGVQFYPITPGLRRFVADAPARLPLRRCPGESNAMVSPPPPLSRADRSRLLASVRTEVDACRQCERGSRSTARIRGQGACRRGLMVVGHWTGTPEAWQDGMFFGPEEDALFWKMMAAINLQPDDIYVASCIKCVSSDHAEPGQQHPCQGYLEKEVQGVAPVLVCAMGEVACHWLLDAAQPLFRIRGRRFPCRCYLESRVIPTLHPAALLRHPELKRLAWADLQKIQHYLQAGLQT